jgi:hypothetical protein
MSLSRRQRIAVIAIFTALSALVGAAAFMLATPVPASADPHCPIDDPNPPPACGGEKQTTTTKKRTTPAPPPVALEPVVFIELGDACVGGNVGAMAGSAVTGILGGHTYATCAGTDLRVGAWPSYQNPSQGAAERRLALMTARDPGFRTYGVRISSRHLEDSFRTEMEKQRSRIEEGGRRLDSYTTGLVAPDAVSSRITVKKTVLGFDGRATAIITDRLSIRDGDVACTPDTRIETNAAADFGQVLGDFLHFTFDDDAVDIRGSFRSELDRAGTPGCQLAKLIPDYVLLPPVPGFGTKRINLTPGRVGVANGNVEIGGSWTDVERNPRVALGVQDGNARSTLTGTRIPLSVRPLDMSGTTHVTVKVGGIVRAEVDLPGVRGQEPPGQTIDVVAPVEHKEGARVTMTVTATDVDGVVSKPAQKQWVYVEPREPVHRCNDATTKTTTKSAVPGPGNCQTPGINPKEPAPTFLLNPQPEPPGVL